MRKSSNEIERKGLESQTETTWMQPRIQSQVQFQTESSVLPDTHDLPQTSLPISKDSYSQTQKELSGMEVSYGSKPSPVKKPSSTEVSKYSTKTSAPEKFPMTEASTIQHNSQSKTDSAPSTFDTLLHPTMPYFSKSLDTNIRDPKRLTFTKKQREQSVPGNPKPKRRFPGPPSNWNSTVHLEDRKSKQ